MKNIFLKQKIFLLFGSSLQCNIIGTIKKLSDFIVQETNSGLIKQKTDDDRKKLEEIFIEQIPQLAKRINNDQSLTGIQKAQEIRKMQRIQSKGFKYMFENINAVQLQMAVDKVGTHKILSIYTLMDIKVEKSQEDELLRCINDATNDHFGRLPAASLVNTLSIISETSIPLEDLKGLSDILQEYQIAEVYYQYENGMQTKQDLQISYKNKTKNIPPLILTFRATADTNIPDINYQFLEIDLENSIVSGVMEEYQFAKPQQFKKALQNKITSLVSGIPTTAEDAKNYINNTPENFIKFLHELIADPSNIKSTISIPDCGLEASPIENDWLKISLIGIIIIAVIVVAYRYFTKRPVQDQINGDPQHNTDENIISNTDEGNNLIGAEAQ